MTDNIRNFCIIAHIDHGKSTLADRFLELTHTVADRDMKAQVLDSMDLERERGITIKLQPVRMQYKDYILNLIDTPGHVDFSYEVSRSLQAVEGAILLVDAAQGIEAQTLANLYLAIEQNLTIIPVVNKIDLPQADPLRVRDELVNLLGIDSSDVLYASGKTGQGVEAILDEVIKQVPPPKGSADVDARALVFDSYYDDYRGVIMYVRMVEGRIANHEKLYLIGARTETQALEVGTFSPELKPKDEIEAGEIGYIITGFKEVREARVGDTVTLRGSVATPLPGYRKVKPMVFAGFFPESGDEYPKLRDAILQINLTDAALSFEPEHSPALGFGFRCGFLGMLHMEIISERIRREHGIELVITTPSVAYEVVPRSGEVIMIHSPLELPDRAGISEVREPWVRGEIVTPKEYLGPIMQLIQQKHGQFGKTEYLDEDRVVMHFEVPLAGLITDFYDTLKGATSGYASLNYEVTNFRPADVARLDILVAEEIVESFSMLVNKDDVYNTGKHIVAKLKDLIPRHQFVIKLQAAVGGKIIAAERIAALRKDVTAKLYGGDVTRKRKLLEKQKKGKQRMMASGKVEIPSRAFLEVLKKG